MNHLKTVRKKFGNRGYVMILDAVVALVVLVTVITLISSMNPPASNSMSVTSFKNIHYLSEDSLDVLNKQGVLDDIGTEWAAANGSSTSQNWLNASNITREYLDKMIPQQFGYRLTIDNDTNIIYDSDLDTNSTRPKESSSITETHSSRLLVGYGRGLPVLGQVARAYLNSIREKTTSEYVYFGGFEGQGELTKVMKLPASTNTVKKICLDYDAGDDFNLKINDYSVAGTLPKSATNMSSQTICYDYINHSAITNYMKPGNNTFTLTFTGSDIRYYYISGGYITTEYNTTQLDTLPAAGNMKYDFPGIYGLINLYSSFYVPGTLTSMNAHLRFDNNYSTYLTIGDVIVFNASENASKTFCNISGSTYTCDINATNLSSMLQAGGLYNSDLSESTIPLRMGTENLTGLIGILNNSDIILITDTTGSMDYRIGYDDDDNGTHITDCDNPMINNSNTSKLSLAKCIDKTFIKNTFEKSPYSRVGLVAFSDTAYSSVPLTNNTATLNAEINSYNASGGTCICCAINKAIQLLNNSVDAIRQGSIWKTKSFTSTGSNCDPTALSTSNPPTPPGWNTTSFNDNSWGNTQLVYRRSSTTNAVWYFRKHFTLNTTAAGNFTFQVENQRGVECYLNGQLVGVDKTCANGTNWNHEWDVPNSYFNAPGVDNVMACRTRCGGISGISNGLVFDARLTNDTKKRYIIVMTDGIASYDCGGCGAPPTCSGSCTSTTGDDIWGCSGGLSDCNGTRCNPAIYDAECGAKRANDINGIEVDSVGFGICGEEYCLNGNHTLERIAEYGDGIAFSSNKPEDLYNIYDLLLKHMLDSTYQSQTVEITGNMTNSTLYPESYIQFKYTTPSNDSALYGDVTITEKTGKFNDITTCSGNLFIPKLAKVVDARVTSYSADHWTDKVSVNNTNTIYTIRNQEFGSEYPLIGDPYIIPIPPRFILSGQNNTITIGTGDVPLPDWNDTGCSPDNSAIYTIRLNERVDYGNVFPEKSGCLWTIQFEDNTYITEKIPTSYNGTKTCTFSQANVSFDNTDAVDDAIYRLLLNLDSVNRNNKVDVKFDSSMVKFDYSQAGGVKSLWGPISMKLVIWT